MEVLVYSMSIIPFLTTQIALQNTTMMMHRNHRRQMEDEEKKKKEQQETFSDYDATRYTAPEVYEPKHGHEEKEYIPKHAIKEEDQVSM